MDIRAKEQYPELEPFDIVINNAGVQNEEDIDVNLKGTIGITEKYGIRPGIRSVLMIGSASGHNGSEFPEYVASKGGVLSYTKNVALRIAKYVMLVVDGKATRVGFQMDGDKKVRVAKATGKVID